MQTLGKRRNLAEIFPRMLANSNCVCTRSTSFSLRYLDQARQHVPIAQMFEVQAIDRNAECANFIRHWIAIF